MSFSFGFGGDDIEQDETEKNETVPAAAGKKAQPFVEPVTYTLTDLVSHFYEAKNPDRLTTSVEG